MAGNFSKEVFIGPYRPKYKTIRFEDSMGDLKFPFLVEDILSAIIDYDNKVVIIGKTAIITDSFKMRSKLESKVLTDAEIVIVAKQFNDRIALNEAYREGIAAMTSAIPIVDKPFFRAGRQWVPVLCLADDDDKAKDAYRLVLEDLRQAKDIYGFVLRRRFMTRNKVARYVFYITYDPLSTKKFWKHEQALARQPYYINETIDVDGIDANNRLVGFRLLFG